MSTILHKSKFNKFIILAYAVRVVQRRLTWCRLFNIILVNMIYFLLCADSTDAISSHIEVLQDQFLVLLQKHCSAKDSTRFGRVMLLLPNICCTANKETLEHLLFPSSSSDDMYTVLSRILMYTSMWKSILKNLIYRLNCKLLGQCYGPKWCCVTSQSICK